MAKKLRLEKIYPRDVKALGSLANCGHVAYEQLREFVRDKRLYTYERSGLVERVIYSRPGLREADRIAYKLTHKGRDFCRDHLSMTRAYLPQSPSHDLALADRYFRLTEAERATWRTETENRDQLAEHIRQLREQGEEERARELWERMKEGRISVPDAVYVREDGVTIAFEVVTCHYGHEEIEAKEEAAQALGVEIEFFRV